MKSIQHLCQSDLEAVNTCIAHSLCSDISLVEDIASYIINAGGKRLRPILVLLISKALADQTDKRITLAAIIECLHTATLLHDDVVDESTQRRGQATVNEHWGNAPSVLVGDFIYSRAFQMIVSLDNHQVTAEIAQATSQIAEGEVQQLINAGNAGTSEHAYFETIKRKTAILFAAAAKSASLLATATTDVQQAMYHYGLNLGIAFQLIDDTLDYRGNPQNMGKNIGDDLSEGKMTLPLIYTYLHAKQQDAAIIRQAIEQKDTSVSEHIIKLVLDGESIALTLNKAKYFAQLAKQQLSVLAASEHKTALEHLVDIAINREA